MSENLIYSIPPHRQGKNVNGDKIPGGVTPLAPNEVRKYKGVDVKGYIPSQFRNN